MTYAQKDYISKIGNTDKTIAESGSLLTAIANLLSRFESTIDPESLNKYFIERDIDPTNLTWGHISTVQPSVGIFTIGTGDPKFSDSIVVFNHNNRISYAVVADANAATIIDSFDGEEKDWNLYGSPKMFVTFVKYQPLEVTPLALAIPALPVVADEEVETGDLNETSNVLEAPAQEKFDLTKDEPIDTTKGIYAESDTIIPVRTLSEGTDWKMTLKTGLGVIEGIAKKDAIIHDLDGVNPDIELKEGTLVYIAGRFVRDGDPYYRTVGSTQNDHWYGIPAGVLSKTEKQEDDDFEHMLDDISLDIDDNDKNLSKRGKVIKSAATVEGKVLNLFKRDKNKKNKETA